MKHLRRSAAAAQRGAAALVVTLLLFFAMALAGAYANRNLLVEQRASAAQVRATVAFEAAEAGLEWAIAMLNSAQPIGADCRADGTAGSSPFRERFLRYDPSTGQHLPRSWTQPDGSTRALRAACLRSAAGWSCSCPSSGQPALAERSGETTPTFVVEFAAATRAGLLQLTSEGCSDRAAPCAPEASERSDAVSRARVTLALVGALRTRPLAPLTAAGDVDASSHPIGLQNGDPMSGGRVVHAGGSVDAPAARIRTSGGASPHLALAAGDADLRAVGAERLFLRHFGLDKASWQQQAGIRRIACETDCAARLSAAAASARMIWVGGDLRIDEPIALGTPERPIVVVAEGEVRISGSTAWHGVLYGNSLRWDDAPAGSALLRGAAIVEAGYSGNGAPDFVYDPAVLARLQHDSGSYVRLPGSWRDF